MERDGFKEVLRVIPKVHFDIRGSFFEMYREKDYQDKKISPSFVQVNTSSSEKRVLRGMHAQPGQDKLLTVIKGEIYDVVVDIRPDSPTFKDYAGYYLDDQKHEQIYIPSGFAHGFVVLSNEAHIVYQVSSYYDPKTEITFRYDDDEIAIKWPIGDPILSSRDENAPPLAKVLVA